MNNLVDLKLDKTKLNPSFDEYKLSLDVIPCYKLHLEYNPEILQLSDKQFSLQHVKAFGNQNTLFQDPWMSNVVYFIDERWKVMKFQVFQESNLEVPKSLLQIPGAKERGLNKERICGSLSFASSKWAFLSDGSGKLYIVDTFNREEDLMWKICHSCEPVDENTPFKLLHSSSHCEGALEVLDCVLVHVESNEASEGSTNKSLFTTVLEWLTFSQVEGCDDPSFELTRVRRLEGKASADFCAILPGGVGVDISSERPFKMVYDSTKPITTEESKKDDEGDFEKIDHPKDEAEDKNATELYYWSQTDEDVTLYITLPPNTSKADINVTIKLKLLKVALNSGVEVLSGCPLRDIDVDESTWIVTNEEIKSGVGDFVKPDQLRLHVIMAKKEEEKWTEALSGSDRKGLFVTDEKQIAQIRSLDHLTSDRMNPDPVESGDPAYNVQELEDCDMYPDENSVLMRFEGDSHQVTHQVNLGSHQWLFNACSEENKLPCLCIRHDVDGIVWQPDPLQTSSTTTPWTHAATFDAFGYVHASKQQRRFTQCAPDFSYALICDAVRHMYLYRQPTPTCTDLRNRKTGRRVNSVAKQQLISLETVDTISGLCATKERIFAIAGNTMHVLKVA